jgi:T-complex protein 1 subunit alpha
MISGAKTSRAATLLLRGANDMHLDEMDRSLHDALCVVKRVLESGSVVPGGSQFLRLSFCRSINPFLLPMAR